MRIRFLSLLAMISMAGLVAGCGVGVVDSSPSVSRNVAGAAFKGKLFGGQQPIAYATVTVYAAGNAGYGSAAKALAATATDADGSYYFTSIACTSGAPLYVLSAGGLPETSSTSNNTAAVLGAGLGLCSNGTVSQTIQDSGVIINEISTVAMAYSMDRFFSTTAPTGSPACMVGTSTCSDAYPDASGSSSLYVADTVSEGFGGPGTYSVGLSNADAYTIPALVPYGSGFPNTSTTSGSTTIKVEYGKMYALANSLAACVNAASGSDGQCPSLFADTTAPGASTAPTDTLQAAVNIALYPYQHAAGIFGLAPPQPAFSPVLHTAPPDFSLGVSYSTSGLGLTVATGAVSTIDIDASGNVWFPSNSSTTPGIAYLSPSSSTFSAVFNPGNNLVAPNQVAIDENSVVWADDLSGSHLVGESTGGGYSVVDVAGPITSLTINSDDSVRFGLTLSSSSYAEAEYSGRVTALNSSFTTPLATIAGGSSNADLAAQASGTSVSASYLDSTGSPISSYVASPAYPGQTAYTPAGFAGLAASTGSGNSSFCLNSNRACYALYSETSSSSIAAPTYGMAVDGSGTLWITENTGKVLGAPLVTSSSYVTTSASAVEGYEYDHTASASGGGTVTSPYGVAIDNSGNVWVSNANGSGFTLTEMVGLASPTITPVSAQITGTSILTATQPTR